MSSRRIILNTSAMYVRSVIGVAFTLFSTRWVLSALGPSDFGLYAVVGTLIVFITFINSVLSKSAGRFFAFAIGQGDPDDLNRWFNAALSLHFLMAAILSLVGWPIGEYCINHLLTIPPDRVLTSLWIFRISLVTAFIGMASVPCIAMFTAQQRIFELALWGLLQTFATFVLAWRLTLVASDRLIFYAAGMAGISCLIFLIQVARAAGIFPACRIRTAYWFDFRRSREMFAFALWSAIGVGGSMLRNQGSAILLNTFHGPVANAAFGLANQVSVQTMQLSNSMLGAMKPEIALREGRGDRIRMLSLATRACRVGTLLGALFSIPLIVEMDFVLQLWLENPPAHTATMCRLMLAVFLVDQLTVGYMMAVSARGKIAAYQLTLGTMLVLTLPLAWLFLKLEYSPSSVVSAAVITMCGCSLGRVFWVRHMFNIPIRSYVAQVFLPCVATIVTAALLACGPALCLTPSLLRLALTSGTGISAVAAIGWRVSLNTDERRFLIGVAKRLLARFHPTVSSIH